MDRLFLTYQIMLHHLVSTNPNDYSTIKFRSSIASLNSIVMYRINSLSTIASFSMTTPDDYMIIETTIEDEAVELTLHFTDHGYYEMRTLTYELNRLFEGQLIPLEGDPPIEFLISMDSTNRLSITANKEFVIKEASHRAKLILGLYHTQLPIASNAKTIMTQSVPYLSYGNVLYLTSKTDFISVVNIDDHEINRSICYKVNELLYPGVPICSKIPGNWSLIHTDQLSTLEFKLVDFQLQPIVLHAPLYVSIEIQNLSNNQPDDIMKFIE